MGEAGALLLTSRVRGRRFRGKRLKKKYGDVVEITPSRQSVRSVLEKARELIGSHRGLLPEVLMSRIHFQLTVVGCELKTRITKNKS